MAGTHDYKIYNASNEYVACIKYLEDCAAMVSILGDGATIRYGHNKKGILWTEGNETQSAGESYDHTAAICQQRKDAPGFYGARK